MPLWTEGMVDETWGPKKGSILEESFFLVIPWCLLALKSQDAVSNQHLAALFCNLPLELGDGKRHPSSWIFMDLPTQFFVDLSSDHQMYLQYQYTLPNLCGRARLAKAVWCLKHQPHIMHGACAPKWMRKARFKATGWGFVAHVVQKQSETHGASSRRIPHMQYFAVLYTELLSLASLTSERLQ